MNPMMQLSKKKINLINTIQQHKQAELHCKQIGEWDDWKANLDYLESRLEEVEKAIRQRCMELRGATSK